jgi:hypothetical protein
MQYPGTVSSTCICLSTIDTCRERGIFEPDTGIRISIMRRENMLFPERPMNKIK